MKRSCIGKPSPSSSPYPHDLNPPTLYFYRISHSILMHTSASLVFPSNVHIASSCLPNAPVLPSLFTGQRLNSDWHKNYFQETKRRNILGEKWKAKRLRQDNCIFGFWTFLRQEWLYGFQVLENFDTWHTDTWHRKSYLQSSGTLHNHDQTEIEILSWRISWHL